MSDISSTGSMPVSAFIGDSVARIAPDATLHEVASSLVDRGLGALAVGAEDGPTTAVITERDLVRALAQELDPSATTAADVGTAELVCCDAQASVAEVAEMMMTRYVRHVLVEEDGEIVGMVSARDLLGVYAAPDIDVDQR